MKHSPMPIVRPVPAPFKKGRWLLNLWGWAAYKRQWELVEDYVYFCPTLKRFFIIPAGFIMDFASIPFFIRWIPGLAKTGILLRNAVPHDFMYRHGFLFEHGSNGKYQIVCQKVADTLFKNYGVVATNAILVNNLAYIALRVFGRFSYKPKPYNGNHGKN